jgi:hypothetical protein
MSFASNWLNGFRAGKRLAGGSVKGALGWPARRHNDMQSPSFGRLRIIMLKRTLFVALAIVALFFVYVATQPSTFRVERSAIIVAPSDVVFAQINNFRSWDAWSPWAKLDPNAKMTFEGPEAGKGAVVRWAGNSEVGEGSMTVVDSTPDNHIKIRVAFEKPWASASDSEFMIRPDGPRTVVTWAMSGEMGFLEKAICVFANGEKMIGTQFEKGLANLKKVAESKSALAEPGPT